MKISKPEKLLLTRKLKCKPLKNIDNYAINKISGNAKYPRNYT